MVLLLAACEGARVVEQSAGAIELGAPEVHGCFVRRGDACVLVEGVPRKVGVWLDVSPYAVVSVVIDGTSTEQRTRVADGGLRIEVEVPAAAQLVTIDGVDPAWTRPFAMPIERVPALPVLAEARALQRAGRSEAAIELLREGLAGDPLTQMRIHDALRAFAVAAGDADGVLEHATAMAAIAEAQGYPAHLADASFAAFHHHWSRGELGLARQWAERTRRAGAGAPNLALASAYEEGLLASASGDADLATRSFATMRRIAERAGDVEWMSAAAQWQALALAELGRADDARAVARDAVQYAEHESTSCADRLLILDNVAWMSIRLAQSGLPYDPPHDLLDQMLAAAAPDGTCPSPDMLDEARINLAFAWLVEDEPELAYEVTQALLAAHEPASAEWVDELAATTALATGRWSEVPELPSTTRDPWIAWLGAVRYADTLERSGLDDAAIEAWIALEQRLDRAVRQVGVDAEQERFLAGRVVSAQRLVDLLLRGGHDEAAMCRARLAIARAVQAGDRVARTAVLSPAQRTAWNEEIERYQALRTANEQAAQGEWVLPAEELERVRRRRREQLEIADARIDELLGISPPPADCARLREPSATRRLLVAFETSDDVVVFVADGARVQTLRVSADATWAAALAQPLATLGDAELVTVLAGGIATTIPFHALGDAPLLGQTPIAYGLDLISRPAALAEHPYAAALVVADPRGDLDAAAQESAIVEQRLHEQGWAVTLHTGRAATREAVLAGLGNVSLFHYAGHGSRGVASWDAALRLADDTELKSGDVLTVPRVPANVVLAGCHTGRREAATITGGMSLGRAFVLAGADAVIVADAEVDDAATRALSEALYADAQLDLPTALRRAQTKLRERGLADWSAFRVLVR
jgi:hypothetical protein